jgi:hypothetical protein
MVKKVVAWLFRPAPVLSLEEKVDKLLHISGMIEIDFWALFLCFALFLVRFWR